MINNSKGNQINNVGNKFIVEEQILNDLILVERTKKLLPMSEEEKLILYKYRNLIYVAMLKFAETHNFNNESFLLGLTEAVEQIKTEYEILELELANNKDKLNDIKFAFVRVLGLIEDTMIQYGANIKVNDLCSTLNSQ